MCPCIRPISIARFVIHRVCEVLHLRPPARILMRLVVLFCVLAACWASAQLDGSSSMTLTPAPISSPCSNNVSTPAPTSSISCKNLSFVESLKCAKSGGTCVPIKAGCDLLGGSFERRLCGREKSCGCCVAMPSPSPTAMPPTPTSEVVALRAFWGALNGPGWVRKKNWNSTSDPCSRTNGWQGVVCDRRQSNPTVLALHMSYNRLTGQLPREIRLLSNLTLLIVDGNVLQGTLPAELGQLSSLRELVANDNSLTGHVPWQVGNLTNLTGLFLSTNQLSGPVANAIDSVLPLADTLAALGLGGNAFDVTELPPQIGNFTRLKRLLLGYNRPGFVGSIPSQIGSLTKLTGLWLSDNNLTGKSHSPCPKTHRSLVICPALFVLRRSNTTHDRRLDESAIFVPRYKQLRRQLASRNRTAGKPSYSVDQQRWAGG